MQQGLVRVEGDHHECPWCDGMGATDVFAPCYACRGDGETFVVYWLEPNAALEWAALLDAGINPEQALFA